MRNFIIYFSYSAFSFLLHPTTLPPSGKIHESSTLSSFYWIELAVVPNE